jgi:UDP-2-acetamido-3-amino-2,3-dideoxy-glucuronate N-acetyltransferase
MHSKSLRYGDHHHHDANIHPTAYIEEPSEIGIGTSVGLYSHIHSHAVVGHGCEISAYVNIASGVLIGHDVKLMNNVSLQSGVIIEDCVMLGQNTVVMPLESIRAGKSRQSHLKPTLIKRFAHIAPNVTLAAGFTIGRYSFTEAGAVIDRNIPDFAIMLGNPIRLAGWRCECGELLPFESQTRVQCVSCLRQYSQLADEEIVLLSAESSRPQHDSHIQPSPSIRPFKKRH